MNRMAWSGVSLAALLLAGAMGVACAESSGQPANTASAGGAEGVPLDNSAEEDQSPGAEELRSFHRHHHIGFIGYAFVSLPTLGLNPQEQGQVDKIKADMQAKLQPQHDAMAAVLTTAADGVAAGTIDQAKADAAIAKLGEVSTQMDDVTNDALNQLHQALTPPERQALAMKVQAHFMVWERANADKEAQPDQEQEGGHIHHLAEVLGLSPDQVQKIDAAFTASMQQVFAAKQFDKAAAEAHLQAFVSGFSADQFDAKTLTTADKANSGITTWGAMRMVKMYEAMTPVLTPDQRTKLAALLREHATKLEPK
jgi:Spy/CpxP family protein refolding chaperone